MTLSGLAYAGLEQAINRYLDLDPSSKTRLTQLHGRVIAFDVVGLGTTFYLVPTPARLLILAQFEDEPDCRLRGTPIALARMGDQRSSSDLLFSGEVEISGDTELAHRFGKVLASMDIDWEEQLSHFTGDIIAHHIGSTTRATMRWGGHAVNTLGRDIQEYLQEELRLLPDRREIEQFLSSVETLRDDLERLQARVERLRLETTDHSKEPE
jgi:ubiquinone biosynthesis protein UbiJ